MIVVGAAIAVLADNLGRKLGKSRLRVGKLRPRHTAMLFTAITGAVVTMTTILVVTILSAEVREWIIEGRAAVKQYKSLVAQRDKMDREVEKVNSQLNSAREDLNEQNLRIAKLRKDLLSAQGSFRTAEGQANAAESRASAAAEQLRERERRLNELTKNLKLAAAKLTQVQRDSVKLNDTYQRVNSNYRQLTANYKKLSEQVDAAYAQDRILREQNMNLEVANAELQKNIEGLTADISKGLTRLGDLTSKIDSQEKTLRSMEQMVFGYRDGAIGARTRPVIYDLGQEIARRDVGLALTYSDAEQRVRSTINLAAEEVYKRTTLGIGLRQVIQRTHTSDEIIGILARELLDCKGPASIVVKAATNVFGDETGVPVEVDVLNNPVVFKRGSVLGEIRIPGDQSVDEIIGMITSMLGKQVRDKAVQARMHGSNDPDSQIGHVEPADTIKVVNAIKEVNRPVRVSAVAKTDTRASGPLEIELRVR